jgi:hypothetical protein
MSEETTTIEKHGNILTTFCTRVVLGSQFGDVEVRNEEGTDEEIQEAIRRSIQERDANEEAVFLSLWKSALQLVQNAAQEEIERGEGEQYEKSPGSEELPLITGGGEDEDGDNHTQVDKAFR